MKQSQLTVGIYTLGCKVNQYESEAIAEALTRKGIAVLPPEQVCDAYIINTCTVTGESDRKARQFIRRAIGENPEARILVTGCFAQVSAESIAAIPGVDYICGNGNKMSVVEKTLSLLATDRKTEKTETAVMPLEACPYEEAGISRFDRTRAYIKIEDGCENRCAYCIIPKARGKVRSREPESVLAEIRRVADSGCPEVVLTGIETASYGKDLENVGLADLLEKADRIPGLERIRLGSLDPSLMKREFVDRISSLTHLAPHFHLSLQSGSDRILARMRRKYNRQMALDGIERLRRALPGVNLTTDVIVGFPGETDEDFEQTLDFARRARFLMIHVFTYSRRPGTEADGMPDQVPEPIKHERSARLIALAKEIRAEMLAEIASQSPTLRVLFETDADGFAVGHIDSFIEVKAPSEIPRHSSFADVKITSSDGDTLLGSIL